MGKERFWEPGVELVTKKEAAGLLRVSTRTIERMVRDRHVSSTKPLGKVLIPLDEIASLIEGTWRPAKGFTLDADHKE